MYEQMRADFLRALPKMSGLTIAEVLRALDQVASGYDVSKKPTLVEDAPSELPEMVRTYLMYKKMAGLSEGTLENYKSTLGVFFKDVKLPPECVSANDIRMWLYNYQMSHGITNRTLDKYREYISRFFSWAHDEGYIPMNPARNIEGIKYEEKPRESLTQIELEYLRMACKTPRELAIIETLYSTGCRVSELATIKLSDIDWHTKSVHLFGKQDFADVIRALKDNTKMTEEMFVQSSRDRIIDFAAKAGDENSVVSREEFNRIFKVYEKYEKFLEEHGLTNGEIDIAYRIIRESYEKHMKNHTFIEDMRGYSV